MGKGREGEGGRGRRREGASAIGCIGHSSSFDEIHWATSLGAWLCYGYNLVSGDNFFLPPKLCLSIATRVFYEMRITFSLFSWCSCVNLFLTLHSSWILKKFPCTCHAICTQFLVSLCPSPYLGGFEGLDRSNFAPTADN